MVVIPPTEVVARRFVRKALTLAAAVVMLAGCVPGPGTPVPTFQCSGADRDAPRTPCTQEEFEAQQKTYDLEREAMIVYEKYWAAKMAVMEEGAPADASLRLSPYLDDPLLSVTLASLDQERELGLQPSQIKHSLRMWPSTERVEGSIVAITGCEDTRGSTYPHTKAGTTHGA